MRTFRLAVLVVGLFACSDDGNTQAPDTELDGVPAALSNQKRAEISFHPLGNANSFFCVIDGGTPVQCLSPFVMDLPDGAHTFEVAAALNAKVDETPATHSWTIDTVAPTTTLLMGPPALDNSANPTLTFEGSDNRGAITFECALDGAAFAACTSPVTVPVADGAHEFRVRAKDDAGNADDSPAVHAWTVDTSAPETTISAGPDEGATSGPAGSFALSSNDAGATFECSLDGAAFAPCTSPVPFALGDGPHAFAARAVDAGGLRDPSPATRGWTVDAVAPDVTIAQGPPNPSNDSTPSFTFTSSDPSAAFQCRVDGGAFAACTSPFDSSALADGNHAFDVRASDPFGNTSGAATHAWTVDTVAPTVTITGAPPAATADATPTITFATAGAPAAVECAVDGGAFAACTSPFTSAALADGAHQIAVRATDAAGNSGSAMASFSVDTTPPTVAILTGPGALTNDATPTFTFTVTGAMTIDCRVDAGVFAACTSPVTTAALGEGSHTFTVRGTDGVGNQATASSTFTVDTVAPSVTFTAQPSALSSDTTPTAAFTTAGSPATIECSVDGGAFAACTSPFTSGALADGSHTITVRVTDTAGNSSTATTSSFTIDTAAPTVAITSEPAALSSDATPTVAFTTAGSPTSTQCQVDAGAFAACASPFTSGALADGNHTITVRVTDGAGNSSTATTNTFAIDTVAPTVTITSQPASPTNNQMATVAFTTAGAPTTVQCRVDAGALAACTSPFTASVADGAHTITIVVTDGAGNSSQATTSSFTVDTVAPTVTITSQPASPSNDPTPSVAFTTAGAPTSTQCQVDAGAFAACTSPFTSGALADGSHTITVRVTDAAGNSSQATTSPFVIDTVAPTVTITAEPASPSNDNTPTVAFTTAGAPTTTRCRVDAGALANCTSPFTAGAVADGSHTITIVVTDAAGNSGSATTAAFVVDTTPPTVTITAQPAALSNDSTPTVTFTPGGAPTTIQCQLDAGAFATCTSPFTTSVADGAHTITVRVTDAVGNAAQATTNSFTVDTAAPTVTITSEPAALSNDTTPTVTFTTGGSPTTTQCRVDSGTLAGCTSPFTATVAEGAHTITIVVTDGAGNSASATTNSFTVDTTPPTVTITGQPNALSNDTTPTVTFTTAGSPTSTQCQVDGGAFATCTSPFTATVVDGAHTITVRVTDGAGNSSSATTASFTVDTTAPVVTITSQPASPTNDNTPTVAFTVTGGASTIQCRVDAGALATCTSPFTSGALADGNHTITIVATDSVGNAGSATTNTFTIDTVAPTVTITAQPTSLSNDSTPTVTFTTGGAPTSTQCRVDAGAFASCTSPFTTTVADGTHTITVRVQDAAGNAATATTASFTVDTTAPIVSFDERPPSTWPVNYFDMRFSANESAAFTCSLNGGAFATCSTGQTFTTTYNALSTFTVRATDAVGNVGQATTTWTSTDGLVLHYPYEQGRTNNTSLLEQVPSHSPDGSIASLPSVGGWAGTSLGSTIPTHTYRTRRPLLSSATTGFYTASFWVRTVNDLSNGTLLSTLGTGGFRVRFAGIGMTVEVLDPATGQLGSRTVTVGLDKWTHVALQATGPGKGLAIYLNGNFSGAVNVPVGTGFDTGQADLQVGSISGIDLDDLRFYNEAVNTTEICTTLARGFFNGQLLCIPLTPGFELDFENNRFVDTGQWDLPLIIPQGATAFVGTKLGNGIRMTENASWGYTFGATGFRSFANTVPNDVGRSFSLWFDATQPAFGNLIRFTQSCPQGGTCGMALSYTATNNLQLFTGTGLGHQKITDIPFTIQGQMTSVLVTEQRNAAGGTTSITVFVNGQPAVVIPTDGVNIYASVSDNVLLAERIGMRVDEYEFWTADLSKDPESLCQNGLDGEFDHLTGSCALTSL